MTLQLTQHTNGSPNWCYIHIPKCAGWSVATAFGRKFVVHDLAYQTISKHPNCLLAATARNTFDRYFSCWKYSKGLRDSGIDFEKFIFEKVVPGNYTWFGSDGVLRYVLRQEDEANLINYYINFSELQKNFDNFCDYAGIEKRTLPLSNETYYHDYRKVYTPKMVDHIYDFAKEEISYFNWDFEDPNQCADYFHQYIDLEKNNFTKKDRLSGKV